MTDPVTKELARGCTGASRGCMGGAQSVLPTSIFVSLASGLRSVGHFFGTLFG
jgi:hypothetical protein